jgi:hypothetical protein
MNICIFTPFSTKKTFKLFNNLFYEKFYLYIFPILHAGGLQK